MPVSNEREYRSIQVSELETRDGDDGSMIDYNARGSSLTYYDEDGSEYTYDDVQLTSSDFSRYTRTSSGSSSSHIRAHLEGTDIGRQLYQEIKGGYTDRMSFGFTTSKDEWTNEEDHEHNRVVAHRRITAIKKLYDVSAVSLPANDATEISARRLSDGVIAEIKAERLAAEQRARRIRKIRLMMEVGK